MENEIKSGFQVQTRQLEDSMYSFWEVSKYLVTRKTRDYGSNISLFDSWGLFTLNISLEKVTRKGSPKRNGHFFFSSHLGKNFNCQQYMNNKNIFFCLQISDNLQSVNHRVDYMRISITAPSNKPWFWQFFKFSGTTRDIFR